MRTRSLLVPHSFPVLPTDSSVKLLGPSWNRSAGSSDRELSLRRLLQHSIHSDQIASPSQICKRAAHREREKERGVGGRRQIGKKACSCEWESE